MKKSTKIIALIALVLIIMQFFRIDKTNPPVVEAEDFITLTNPPAEVASILKNACYDCHSHHTVYPWYTDIAPISFFLRSHIRGGRQHLNFSTWGTYPTDKAKHKLEEIIEEVGEKVMPMKSYMWLHPEGKMGEKERNTLIEWAKQQKNKIGKKEETPSNENLLKLGISDHPDNQIGGLSVGSIAPDFKAKDQDGNEISLKKQLRDGPVVLIFYRGYWCGYCNQQLEAFEEKLTQLKRKGARVIAVSPENETYAKKTLEKTKSSISIISDKDKSIMSNYKVAFKVTEEYQKKVKKYTNKDLNDLSGYTEATLPIPATYVIDTDGKIKHAFYDPDYSKRANVEDILKVL